MVVAARPEDASAAEAWASRLSLLGVDGEYHTILRQRGNGRPVDMIQDASMLWLFSAPESEADVADEYGVTTVISGMVATRYENDPRMLRIVEHADAFTAIVLLLHARPLRPHGWDGHRPPAWMPTFSRTPRQIEIIDPNAKTDIASVLRNVMNSR